MARTLLTLCSSIVLALSGYADDPAPPAVPDEELVHRVTEWLRPLDEAGQVSGTLLIARGEVVLFEQSYGMADYELEVSNTSATRFNIASATKPLTLILLLSLMSEEELDQPLSKWFPGVPAAETITVRHLAEHRSGIPHRVTTTSEETEPQTAESIAALALESDLLFEPGSDREYSSAGYATLARVLELVGGASYQELLRRHVTSKVGAVRSSHPAPLELIPGRAQGYFYGVRPIPSPPRDLSFLVGAGSVFATAHDLFLVQRGIVGGLYDPLVRDQLLGENGLRWNGYTNGYRTFADLHLRDDLTVVFTANMFTGAGNLIRDAVPRIASGEDVEWPSVPAIEPVAIEPSDQARIEGLYRLGSTNQPFEFHNPELASLGDWILIPIGKDRFFSPQDYAEVSLIKDEDGAALQWGKGPRFPRVDQKGIERR